MVISHFRPPLCKMPPKDDIVASLSLFQLKLTQMEVPKTRTQPNRALI